MVKRKEDTHILVVDDEESIRYSFTIFLEREGYGKITVAATLEEALVLINEHHFDLIISDIVLEDASGTDLLQHIQNTGIQCPVVMITGFPNLQSAAESVRYGAFDYISKPVNKETLLRFVRQALQHWDLEQEKRILQKENERFRRYLQVIFKSVSDAIITVDEDMCIVEANDAASLLMGELSGTEPKNLELLAGDIAKNWHNDALTVIGSGREVREHHVECRLAGGEKRMFSMTAAPLKDENEEFGGVVIVTRDISLENQNDIHLRSVFHGLVGSSPVMQRLYSLIENVGKVDTAVLIKGESGTGKELAAEALHLESKRCDARLVKVDCASIAEDLLESELFGHLKGAFTGADRNREGRLQHADGGTLLLDEIGDISPRMQLRLLRFLQEQTFTPVGGDQPVAVDVRIIAATNADLRQKVEKGEFREDLYYRLKVVEIVLPPLRERQECIPLLVHNFITYFAGRHSLPVYSLSDQAMSVLQQYHWPGNVRQLRHVIERGCVMCQGSSIQKEDLPNEVFEKRATYSGIASYPEASVHMYPTSSIEDRGLTEKDILLNTIELVGGNKSKAAKMLGVNRSTIYRKLKKYRISSS